MSFTSGNVKSINEFMDAAAAFAVANESWIILDGSENQSDVGTFPFNSRYMRIEFADSVDSDLRIQYFEARATLGGASLGVSETNSYNVIGGDTTGLEFFQMFLQNDTDWNPTTSVASFDYDFGVTQTVREIVVGSSSSFASRMPTTVRVYRSEDGEYWDLIHTFSGLSWAASENKVLSLPADATNFSSSTASGGVRRPCKYVLQAPGYDAERRVLVGFELFQDFTDGNQGFRLQGYTGYDSGLDFDNQLNACPIGDCPIFVVDNFGEDIDYWLYVNSSRMIGVLRAGANDYAAFYAGFLASFANPDQHSNPIYIGGTSPNLNTSTVGFLRWNEADTRNSSFWDPGEGGGQFLDYKGDWINTYNNTDDSSLGRRPRGNTTFGTASIAPWFNGASSSVSNSSNDSQSISGNFNETNGDHFLKNQVITLQDELPVFDALLFTSDYGHVGALQGTVAVPGASVLTPEQTITINAVTYRVFPKRTIRDDAQWFAVAEQ